MSSNASASDASDTPPVPPAPPPLPATTTSADPAVKFTRAGALWTALIVGFLILIVLLIFITQNLSDAPVTFLGWHWTLPLGVQLLLAAICGGMVTVAAGTARIFQLRRAAKKNLAAALVAGR